MEETDNMENEVPEDDVYDGSKKELTVSAFLMMLSARTDSLVKKAIRQFYNRVDGEFRSSVRFEESFVRTYLESSPRIDELLRVWVEDELKTSVLSALTTRSISRVIFYSRETNFHNIGSAIARVVVKEHLKLVYRMLISTRPVVIAAALDLLTSCAIHDPNVSKELFVSLNWGLAPLKGFPNWWVSANGLSAKTARRKTGSAAEKSLKYPQERSEETVRSLYIRFICALLRCGDASTILGLLSLKGLFVGFFKRLSSDEPVIISMLVKSLMSFVMRNKAVSFKSKLLLFSSSTAVSSLVACTVAPMASETISDVIELLSMLSTSSDVGFALPLSLQWTGDASSFRGQILLSIATACRPLSVERHKMLVVNILSRNGYLLPEYVSVVVKQYLPSFSSTNDSKTILAALQFLTQLMSDVDLPAFPSSFPLTSSSSHPLVASLIIPPAINAATFWQIGRNSPDSLITNAVGVMWTVLSERLHLWVVQNSSSDEGKAGTEETEEKEGLETDNETSKGSANIDHIYDIFPTSTKAQSIISSSIPLVPIVDILPLVSSTFTPDTSLLSAIASSPLTSSTSAISSMRLLNWISLQRTLIELISIADSSSSMERMIVFKDSSPWVPNSVIRSLVSSSTSILLNCNSLGNYDVVKEELSVLSSVFVNFVESICSEVFSQCRWVPPPSFLLSEFTNILSSHATSPFKQNLVDVSLSSLPTLLTRAGITISSPSAVIVDNSIALWISLPPMECHHDWRVRVLPHLLQTTNNGKLRYWDYARTVSMSSKWKHSSLLNEKDRDSVLISTSAILCAAVIWASKNVRTEEETNDDTRKSSKRNRDGMEENAKATTTLKKEMSNMFPQCCISHLQNIILLTPMCISSSKLDIVSKRSEFLVDLLNSMFSVEESSKNMPEWLKPIAKQLKSFGKSEGKIVKSKKSLEKILIEDFGGNEAIVSDISAHLGEGETIEGKVETSPMKEEESRDDNDDGQIDVDDDHNTEEEHEKENNNAWNSFFEQAEKDCLSSHIGGYGSDEEDLWRHKYYPRWRELCDGSGEFGDASFQGGSKLLLSLQWKKKLETAIRNPRHLYSSSSSSSSPGGTSIESIALSLFAFAYEHPSKFGISLTQLIESENIIILCILCLGSNYPKKMRLLAGKILAGIESIMRSGIDSDLIRDCVNRRQWLSLLSPLHAGFQEDSDSIPSSIAIAYCTLCLDGALTNPLHELYREFLSFLLSRPALDLNDFPLLYTCLYSPSISQRRLVLGILRSCDYREDEDLAVLRRRHIVELLCSLFVGSKELQNERNIKEVVLEILYKLIVNCKDGISFLVTRVAIGAWIQSMFVSLSASIDRAGESNISTSSNGRKFDYRPALLFLVLGMIRRRVKIERDGQSDEIEDSDMKTDAGSESDSNSGDESDSSDSDSTDSDDEDEQSKDENASKAQKRRNNNERIITSKEVHTLGISVLEVVSSCQERSKATKRLTHDFLLIDRVVAEIDSELDKLDELLFE